MANREKPLVWLEGEVKTPPFTSAARLEAGFLLRRQKKSQQTPQKVIDACRNRLKSYDEIS